MVFGKKKKKKVKEPEEEMEEMSEEDYIDEDEDKEEDEEDEEKPNKKIKEEKSDDFEIFVENMNERFRKIESAVTINQKYIKKLWARINKVEEDFKLFIDKGE